VGVQGDNSRLIITVSRIPRELYNLDNNSDTPPIVSDLRRITYWLSGTPDHPLGLARQEVKVVTSDDLMSSIPPDVPDESSYVIAEEVQSLVISYWDGQAWQDSWDGSQPGADGVTPMGPPLAVSIEIGIVKAGSVSTNKATDDRPIKTIRHVVAIPTANGPPAQSTTSTGQ
jgi:hypothetical protein